jgi:hypothetical protein
MESKDFVWACCSVMIIFTLVLIVIMGQKIDSLEREGIIYRTMLYQSTEYIRIINDRYIECKETLSDYRNMVRECDSVQSITRFNYMPSDRFYRPNITPIEPYTINNFIIPNNFTLPHLKTINLTEKDFLVLGACNNSDPYNPCL